MKFDKKIIPYSKFSLLKEATIDFQMNLPKEVLDISDIFKSNGYKLYVVGGAVRDSILKKTPKDYDVATDATPEQIEKMIDGKYKIIDGGKSKDLGVTIMIVNGEPFEVATFREDIGKGRRPEGGVKYSTIESDVKRRDLTMNALFYDIDKKEIVDLVGGIDDIMNGVVKTVGNANDRFEEDPLRKLRAIRFCGVTGSKVDKDVDEVLSRDNSLDGVSPERIRDEFKKTILKAKSTIHVLNMIKKYKFFDKIFPGYKIYDNFKESNNWRLQLGELLKLNEIEDFKHLVSSYKYEADESKYIIFYKEFINFKIDNVLNLSKLNVFFKFTPEELRTIGEWNGMGPNLVEAFIKFKPTVTGDYIMSEFGLSGKDIKDKILELEIGNFKKLLL